MSFLYNNFIATFFEMVLEFMYQNVVHNYIAVVWLTLIILKIALTPIDIKQRESSMRMMKIQPKVDQIRKRYHDPIVQNQKKTELYRKENIKMMGGCLPSLLQMIVIIAFFGALQQMAYNQIVRLVAQAAANPGEAIVLENFLWVKNIWQPEVAATVAGIDYEAVIQPTLAAYSGYANGWYILPLIQGITMYFSFSYSMSTATTADNPMSGPVMKLVMAGMTTWFCLSSNALFTIYWIFSNLLMFVQTYFFKQYFAYKEEKAKEKAV